MSTDDTFSPRAAKKNECVKWCNANNHSGFSIATKGGAFRTDFYADRVVPATAFSTGAADDT